MYIFAKTHFFKNKQKTQKIGKKRLKINKKSLKNAIFKHFQGSLNLAGAGGLEPITKVDNIYIF